MDGCLKVIGRLGCLAAILILVGVAYWYRDPIMHSAAKYLGPHSTRLPPVSDTSVGAPTPGAVRAAAAKLASLGVPGGPDSVVLTPNEMASLIGGGIDWTVRKGFDSLRVELLDSSIAVHARLDTRVLPRDAMGPAEHVLATYEPLRMAGPVTIAKPGVARWKVQELSVHGFPFPGPAVARLAKLVAGADDGSVPVLVPPALHRIAINPTGVVCYRRSGS
ncbi:MAG TPA: hypothetical protein VH163_00875 [Gemmatimonadales bacterium]|nr:hypothetical protein [Gemmatimonadales bacterium]